MNSRLYEALRVAQILLDKHYKSSPLIVVRIILYLSHHDGARTTELINEFNITNSYITRFAAELSDFVETEHIQGVTSNKPLNTYYLTQNGKLFVKLILKELD
ncbi:MAG: hypothetical protein RR091_07130 [Cloacibacillus sp.]